MNDFFQKLRFLLSKRDQLFLLYLIVFSITVSLIETIGVSLIMPFIAVATDFTRIEENPYFASFYESFAFSSPVEFIVAFGICLILFYIFRAMLNLFYLYLLARFARGRYHVIAYRLFENYLGRDYRHFTGLSSGELSKSIITEAQNLTSIFQQLLLMCSELFVIFFIYGLLLWTNWKMTVLLTIIFGLNALFLTQSVSKWIKKEGIKKEEAQKHFFNIITTTFGNFKMIKLKSKDGLILNQFEKQSDIFAKANVANETLSHSPRIFLEALGFGTVVFIVIYLVSKYETNLSGFLPVISVFIVALYRLLPSANRLLSGYNHILFNHKALEIVHNDLIYEIEDLGDTPLLFQRDIVLQNVTFAYTKEKPIFKNIDLTISRGEHIAVTGSSGSGKSTLIDLIIGLYRPVSGTIFVDDTVLDDDTIKAWRKQIGYIPQSIYLFDGSVADNVAFGDEKDEQKIKEALRKANILTFLEEHHEGIETRVGEGGIMLSGGQKQRIAIARALYQNPEVLVLDEATSALDSVTEQKIMQEIYGVCRDKTLIIVAHRLSTIQACHRIYELEEGTLYVRSIKE
jgi:ABC-type multidrug transport system fused ATPase/permease subunit